MATNFQFQDQFSSKLSKYFHPWKLKLESLCIVKQQSISWSIFIWTVWNFPCLENEIGVFIHPITNSNSWYNLPKMKLNPTMMQLKVEYQDQILYKTFTCHCSFYVDFTTVRTSRTTSFYNKIDIQDHLYLPTVPTSPQYNLQTFLNQEKSSWVIGIISLLVPLWRILKL